MKSCANKTLALAIALLPAARATAAEPPPPFLALTQGRQALAAGRHEDALESAMEALTQDPRNGDARRLMRQAAAGAAERWLGKARADRRKILRAAQQAHYLRRLLDRGEDVLAYHHLYSILDEAPGDDWAWRKLGELSSRAASGWRAQAARGFRHYHRGERAACAAAWAEALESAWGPGHEAARDRVVRLLAAVRKDLPRPQGSVEEPAAETASIANPVASGQAADFYMAGLVNYGLGDVGSAVRSLRQALALDPGHERARAALERARRELER